MFGEALEKKIKELDNHLVSYSNEELSFEEKQKEGKMKIKLELRNPCIMFRDLDENCLGYFDNRKTADCIVFEKKEEDVWALHIFEMKKQVKTKEWEKIRIQFKGAYYNALALAGYLGVEQFLQETRLYTCFWRDRMNLDSLASRATLSRGNTLLKEWMQGKVKLDCFETVNFAMKKIEVKEDQSGHLMGHYSFGT